jgi:hypothetical protein
MVPRICAPLIWQLPVLIQFIVSTEFKIENVEVFENPAVEIYRVKCFMDHFKSHALGYVYPF